MLTGSAGICCVSSIFEGTFCFTIFMSYSCVLRPFLFTLSALILFRQLVTASCSLLLLNHTGRSCVLSGAVQVFPHHAMQVDPLVCCPVQYRSFRIMPSRWIHLCAVRYSTGLSASCHAGGSTCVLSGTIQVFPQHAGT